MASSSTRPSVLITGASTGIGAACALELDRRGYRVFAGIRSEADGETLLAQGSKCIRPIRLDVTIDEEIRQAAATIRETVGDAGLAGLVNNAGIVVAGPLEILPMDLLRKQFEVNVLGQLAVTRAMLPLLRIAGGRIVNMGSMNGRIASPYLGPYSASKHALEAISDALRSELRTWGIQVSLVEPGSIATPIWKKSFDAAESLSQSTDSVSMDLYRTDLEAMAQAAQRLSDTAMPVATVVRAVVHALTSRRSRPRYAVGLQTKLLFRAYKWVPDRLWDRLVRNWLGLK